ncbi:MAG: acid phosphatase [Sphingomonadales bacterium]|nr:acid phosphatase [Sphingomonadales bacterium]
MTAPAAVGTPAASAPSGKAAPDSMRWLYGSGEGAAASIQAFRALTDYVDDYVTASDKKYEGTSSVSDYYSPAYHTLIAFNEEGISYTTVASYICPDSADDAHIKPYAVVFDVDETLLLNLGYEYWQASTGSAYSSAIWDEWERTGFAAVAPAPGAVEALKRIRDAGVTVVFNSNRSAKNAEGTVRAIAAAGLGQAVHGETLFLKGDDDTGSAKDQRRWNISKKFCIIAMAGDNLGDFMDAFNEEDLMLAERRALAAHPEIAKLWGNGWFVLPNPVYGASIAGDIDDVFPEAARWMPRETRYEGQ